MPCSVAPHQDLDGPAQVRSHAKGGIASAATSTGGTFKPLVCPCPFLAPSTQLRGDVSMGPW
jgi:hypothetical protein